jgi:hypothetical protein
MLLLKQLKPSASINYTLTRCGYAIVNRLAMSKVKASQPLLRQLKKTYPSIDLDKYQLASPPKVQIVSSTQRVKRLIYEFCLLSIGFSSESLEDFFHQNRYEPDIPIFNRT